MSGPATLGGSDGQTHPGGILDEYEDHPEDGEGSGRPMARAMILTGLGEALSRAWRRPNRRKTSDVVTRIEITINTMMIQV